MKVKANMAYGNVQRQIGGGIIAGTAMLDQKQARDCAVGGGLACPPDKSPVDQEIVRAHSACDATINLLNELEDRLSFVLIPTDSGESNGCGPVAQSAPIVHRLQDINDRIEGQAVALRRIIARLAI